MRILRLLKVLLALAILLSLPTIPAIAEDNIKVLLNGTELLFDVPPQINNGRTMVPMRKIFESLGAEVEWDGATKTITATREDTVIIMQIDNLSFSVSGKEIPLDVAPQLVDSRTLVPIRAVSEGLGALVRWDIDTRTVIITTTEETTAIYQKGTLTETSFESSYLGIRFTLPKGFTMLTEKQLLSLVESSAGQDSTTNDYVQQASVYEMMASAPTGLPNVILMTEKPFLTNITMDMYINVVKIRLSIQNTMECTIDDEITSVEIAGQSYKKFTAHVVGRDISQDYFIRKQDDLIVAFITTYSSDTKTELDALMKGFSKI